MAAAAVTLTQEIETFVKGLDGKIPAPVLDTFHKEMKRMEDAGTNSTLVSVGSSLPDAQLLDAHGNATTLKATLANQPAFLVFYRGEWCPYCNLTLRAYEQRVLPTLKSKGIQLIAVSPQKPDKSLSTQETNKLTFTVVSDPKNQLATSLGITTSHSDEVRAITKQMGKDITEINVDGSILIPMPTVLGVNAKGIIQFIDVHPNYVTRTEPQQIIDAIPSVL